MCQQGLHNLNRRRLGREGSELGQLSEQHTLLSQTPKNSKFKVPAIQLLRRYICQGWRLEHIIVYWLLITLRYLDLWYVGLSVWDSCPGSRKCKSKSA